MRTNGTCSVCLEPITGLQIWTARMSMATGRRSRIHFICYEATNTPIRPYSRRTP